MTMIKLPLPAALKDCLQMLKLRADCTDAVVIIINQKTGEFRAGSIRGEAHHMAEILTKTLNSVNKQKGTKSGLIGIN